MKTIRMMLVLLAVAVPALAEGVWLEQPNYNDVLAKAKAENKYVLLDFYTVWCGPCKRMDKETYPDAKVTAFLNGIIAAKYDSEKGPGIDVSKTLKVNQWPTQVLLDPQGKEVGRYVGFLNAADFVSVMGDYKEGKGTIAYYEKKVEKNPNDATSWKTLGLMYADEREKNKCVAALNRFLELAEDATPDEKAEAYYTMAEVNYVTGSPEEAVTIAEGVLKDYKDTQYYDPATTLLAKSYFKTGEKQKCFDTYMAYVNRHPDDPMALNSFAWFCASRQVFVDEALPIAIKMVELANRDPGYLDTLAELYYASGQFDLAIKTEQEAAEKDPSDSYFTNQIEKYKKAKQSAKQPDSRAQNQ